MTNLFANGELQCEERSELWVTKFKPLALVENGPEILPPKIQSDGSERRIGSVGGWIWEFGAPRSQRAQRSKKIILARTHEKKKKKLSPTHEIFTLGIFILA